MDLASRLNRLVCSDLTPVMDDLHVKIANPHGPVGWGHLPAPVQGARPRLVSVTDSVMVSWLLFAAACGAAVESAPANSPRTSEASESDWLISAAENAVPGSRAELVDGALVVERGGRQIVLPADVVRFIRSQHEEERQPTVVAELLEHVPMTAEDAARLVDELIDHLEQHEPSAVVEHYGQTLEIELDGVVIGTSHDELALALFGIEPSGRESALAGFVEAVRSRRELYRAINALDDDPEWQ